MLGCLTLIYDAVAKVSFVGTMLLLLAIGFTIYGPQVLLVGTAPTDLAKRGTAAAAAGFVNCMGYFGAALLGDLLTGHLAQHYGWEVAIYAWAGWAFLAAILVAFLWNQSGYGSR
jgi:OPA family glycerol-3-phosphate transporter-like MFS transporter